MKMYLTKEDKIAIAGDICAGIDRVHKYLHAKYDKKVVEAREEMTDPDPGVCEILQDNLIVAALALELAGCPTV